MLWFLESGCPHLRQVQLWFGFLVLPIPVILATSLSKMHCRGVLCCWVLIRLGAASVVITQTYACFLTCTADIPLVFVWLGRVFPGRSSSRSVQVLLGLGPCRLHNGLPCCGWELPLLLVGMVLHNDPFCCVLLIGVMSHHVRICSSRCCTGGILCQATLFSVVTKMSIFFLFRYCLMVSFFGVCSIVATLQSFVAPGGLCWLVLGLEEYCPSCYRMSLCAVRLVLSLCLLHLWFAVHVPVPWCVMCFGLFHCWSLILR